MKENKTKTNFSWHCHVQLPPARHCPYSLLPLPAAAPTAAPATVPAPTSPSAAFSAPDVAAYSKDKTIVENY